MSLQKATELKEENITATKLKKKAGSKANPKVKARKQDSSMENADKGVKTKRTSRKESAKATTLAVDPTSQAIQGDLLANLTGDDLSLANTKTSKATKSASLSAKNDSSKDTHKDETTKVPSPIAVAASASASASVSAGAKAKANAKDKAPAKANARANANANASAEAETKTEARSEAAAMVGAEAVGVKAQQRKSKNTKAAPEAKLKVSASHKKDEINDESLLDKDLAHSSAQAKEVVKTKRPASKSSKDRQQAKNKQDVGLASTAVAQTVEPMTASNSTDTSAASSVLTSAASSAVGCAGADADAGAVKGKGLDKGKAGMAAVGGQSVLDEQGMGRLQDALHLQEDQEHAKESKAHTLPKSRKRVIGEIVSRKDSNEVPVNAQIGLIVNRVNSYSSKEFHVNLQISKQLPWLERSLNMVTFSPEQRAIVTSEERFLVVDSVVGAKSVALVVERAVYLYTKLKQQEKHKRVKVLICHGLSSLEGSYLQALQEHMAVLELSDFVICDLNNLPCNPKEFDIVLIDDAQVMLQWKLYALTTNYQFAYCTIFVDGSKLEAFALRRCQQPYEDLLAQGYLPIYSDLELQVLSYAKARANYPFYQYQLAHKKAAKSLKQIGQEYLAPDSTVMIDEALAYLECFYPKAQIDEIINNLYYVLEQKNILSQEKAKEQRPALAGDLNSLEQVKQWLDPKSQERILQESYERSVNWGMYPLGVWHERYHGQGHTLFSSNLDSGLKALSLVYPQQWRLESLNLQFNYLSSQFALDKDTLSGIIPLLSSPSSSPSLSSNSSPMDEAPLAYEQQYLQSPISVQDIDAAMGNVKGYGDDMGLNHSSYAVQDMGSNNKTGDDSTTVLGKRGPRPFSYVELLLKMGFKRREVDNYNFDQGEFFDLPKLCALSLQMDIPVFKSFALGYGSMQVYLNRRFGFELNKHEANGYRSFKANRIFSSFVQKFEDLWLTEYEKLKVEREMRAQSLMSLRLLSLNYQTSPLVLSSCYKFTSLWTKQHDISSRLAPNHEESQFQVIDQNLRIDMLCYAQALKNQAQSQQTSPINNAINSSSKVDSAVTSQDIYQDAIAQALSFNALSSFDSYKLQALCLLSMGKISTNSLSQIFSRTLKACNSASQASTAVPGATVDSASTACTVSAAQIGASTVKSDDITATDTETGTGNSTVSGAGADADAITGVDSNKLLATLEQQLMSYFLQRGISLGELSTLLTWEQLHQTVLAQQVILGQSLHWEPQLGTQKIIMGNSLEQVDKLLNVVPVPVPEMTASKAQVATVTKTGAIAGASASAGASDSFGGSFVSRACAQLKLNSPELLKKVERALAELMACRLGKVWHSAHYVQLQPSVLTRPQDSDLARGSLSLIQYAPALQQVLSQESSFKLEANVTTSATSTCDAASQLVSEVNREFSVSQIELNNLDWSFSMVSGYYAYQALDAFDENMQQHYSFAANYGHIFNSAVIHKIKGQNLTHKLSDHDVTKETYPEEQNLVLGGSWLEQQPNTNGSTNTSNAAMATALDLASATAMPMALVSARGAAVVLASDSSSDAAASDEVASVAEAALKYFLHTYGSQWGYELGAYEQDWHLSAKDIKQLSNQERYLLTLSSYVLNQEQGLKGQSKDASTKVDIYPFALKGASDALIKQFKLVQADYDFAPWYYASWQVVEDWGQRLASNRVLYEIVNSKPGYHFGHFSDQIRANLGHDKLEKLCFALDGAAYELGFTNTIEPQAYGYNYFLAPFINDWVERGYSLEQLQDLVSNALLNNTSWQNHDVSALRATYNNQGDINYKYQLSLACSHYEVNLWANHQPLAAFNYQKELSANKEVLSKALTSNIVCTVPAQIKEKLPDHDLITYVRPYHVGMDNVNSALRSCGMKRLAISTGLGSGPLPGPNVSLNMGQLSGHKASTTKARVGLSYPVKVKTKQVVRAKRVEPQLQPELASDSLLDNGFAQDLDSSLFPNSVQHSDSGTAMPQLPPLPSAVSGDTSLGDVPQLNEVQDGDDWDFEFEQAESNNLASKVNSKQSLDDEFNAIINLSAQQSNNLDNAALVEQAFEFDQDLEQELDQDQNSLEQSAAATQSLDPVPASQLTSLEVPNLVQAQEFDGEEYQANKLAAQVSTALKPHQEPTQGALSLEDAHAQADGQPHSHGHAQGQGQGKDTGQGYGHGLEQAPIEGVSSFGFMEGDYADDDMDGVAFDKEKAITEARAKAQQIVLSKDKVDVNNISLEDAAQSNNLFAMPSGYDLSSVLFDDEFFENEVQPPKPTINQLAKRYWRNFKLNVLPGQPHNGQDNHNGQVTSNTLQSSAHGVAPCSGSAAELGSGTGAFGASAENSHNHSMGTGQLFNGQVKAKVATRDDSKGCASASAGARAGAGAGAAGASAGETFRASSVGTDTTTRVARGETRELKDNSIDYVHAYELNNDLGDFVYSKSTNKASLKAKDSALYEGDIRTLSTNQALQLELDAKGLEHDQEASSNGSKIFTHELAFGEANNNLDSQAHKQERLKEVYSKQNEALQLLCAIAPHGMGSIDVVKVSSYNNYIEGMGAYLQHIESFIPNLDQRYNIFRLKDYSQDQYTATKAVLKKDCPSNLIMSSRNHILSWTDFILRHLSDPIKTSCATSSLESLVWRALNAQFKRQATFSFIERNYYELMKAVKYSHAQTNYRAVISYCQEQLFSPLEHAAINFITNLLLVVAKSDSADISNVQQSTSSINKRKQTVYGYERYFSQESAQHSLQTKLNSEQAELNLRKLHLTPEQQAQLSSFQAPQAQKMLHCALPSGHTLAQDSASDGAKHHLNSSADTLAGISANTSANTNAGASANTGTSTSVSASSSARAGASARASAGGELVKGDGDRSTEDATTALAAEQSWDCAGNGQLEGGAEHGFGCRRGYAYELDCEKLERLLPKEQQRYLILKVLQVSAYLNKAHQRLQVGLFDYQKVLTIQDRVVIAALSDDFVVEVLKLLQDLMVEQSPLLELSSSYELIALVADITHCCPLESLSNLKIQANKNNELNSVNVERVHNKSYLGVNQVAALTKGCQELIGFLEQQELEEVILLERYYAKMRLYAPSAHERVLKLLSAAYLVHFNRDFEVLLNNLLAAFVSPNIGLESEQSSYDWDTEEILDQDSASNSDIWAEAIDDSSNNDLCEPDEQDETGEQSEESEEGFLFDDNFEEGQKVTDKFLRRLKDPCDYHAQWQDLQEYDFKERAFSKDLKAIMEFIISKIEPQMAYSYSNNMISYFNRTRFKLQQDELNLASILAFRGSMCDRMALLVPPSETLSPSELLDALGCARNEIKVINGDDKLTATLAHSSLQALQLRNELIRRLCKPQA
ncbi:hypothetical protein MXE38_10395 [Anaerobiospirillum sp. NML120448]|uniref:hypothetical protein n=1 Tax=Anaerobiospirillum sp. NML120448 TaxID=2932816 RepID=UPI001FF5CE6D|nr:hypothetical protein [Anaerobiospirillum sp. NML120448]MCK0515244.1 hypothetical protein [Anaerobiospirillum sp. NML120448]